MRAKFLIVGIALLSALIVALILIRPQHAVAPTVSITSFEECEKAGYPILETYPEQCRTSSGGLFVRVIDDDSGIEEPLPETPPPYADFGKSVTLNINDTVTFTDGLTVTLKEINDSRCKPDVQCIWAGELSPLLLITGGSLTDPTGEIRLGTTNNTSVTRAGYTFTVTNAAETEATIVVTNAITPTPEGVGTGYLSGHVSIGPICPVERVDHPCVVPPEAYTSRSVVVYASDQAMVKEKAALDAVGNYKITLAAGTYWVQIQPAGIGPGEKKKVTIKSGETQTLNFDIDTGIR
jgi:hypothetical protein